MRRIENLIIFLCLLGSITGGLGCKKYLSQKASSNQQLPNTIATINGLLNNSTVLQEQDPSLLDRVTDEFYVPEDRWPQMELVDQAAYRWEGEMYPQGRTHEWGQVYQKVFIANVALAGLDKMDMQVTDRKEWEITRGTALFTRGRALQQAAFLWAPAYNPNSAAKDKGIPLRLTDDVGEKIVRSSVEETYEQIVNDFKAAATLLPTYFKHALTPSGPAANAYLARTYLAMGKYDSCLKYAKLALSRYAMFFHLAEPNSHYINADPTFIAFTRFNPEVLFDAMANYATTVSYGGGIVDTNLLALYHIKDLRRKYFFAASGDFTGDYSGGYQLFSGIANDEVYLMIAECLARTGNTAEAISTLNNFISVKFDYGDNEPYPDNNPEMVLEYVLNERSKELIRRGVRWMDIKRLNVEGRGIRLKRIIEGQTVVLEPNSPKYALPIPEDVIKMTGIEQN